MKRAILILAIAAALMGSCCVAACSLGRESTGREGAVTSGSVSYLQTTTTVLQEGFRWQPEIGNKYGSDAANRCALGIVDGDGTTLYYQGVNDNGNILYGLYACNEESRKAEKLVDDCGGMLNVNGRYVFYIGYSNLGAFRYDTETKSARQLYSGEVQNLLATQDYLYIVDADYNLRQMNLVSGTWALVAGKVAAHYLQCLDGYVYFGEMNPDNMHCDLYRAEMKDTQKIELVSQGVGYPMGCAGTQVLYGDNEGVQLRDWETGKLDTVFLKGNGASLAAINGNGVFYVARNAEGNLELHMFDLNDKITNAIMPVHCGAVYFIGGQIYLVDVVDLGFEHAVLNTGNPHTEWVVERESGAH